MFNGHCRDVSIHNNISGYVHFAKYRRVYGPMFFSRADKLYHRTHKKLVKTVVGDIVKVLEKACAA